MTPPSRDQRRVANAIRAAELIAALAPEEGALHLEFCARRLEQRAARHARRSDPAMLRQYWRAERDLAERYGR